MTDKTGRCRKQRSPYFAVISEEQVVTGLRHGSHLGYKYIEIPVPNVTVSLIFENSRAGKVVIQFGDVTTVVEVSEGQTTQVTTPLTIAQGIYPMHLTFYGQGTKSIFKSFRIDSID